MKPAPSTSRRHLLYLLAFVTVQDGILHACVSSARLTTPVHGARPAAATISRTITVDIAGRGEFTSVQAAIDSVPDGNTRWVRIFIKRGTYSEKVQIPRTKPFIAMEGEGTHLTVIQWGDYAANNSSHPSTGGGGGNPVPGTAYTGTFTLRADDFVARRVTFENTYSRTPGNPQTQALAVLLEGDRAAFYSCSFLGFQDTLGDDHGRHYFRDCHIEGFVDFIFGSGQSIYEGCNIWVRGSPKPYGFITAHGRADPRSPTGFVFKGCTVAGDGRAYLGRAWGTHPFVLFYRTYMTGAVLPLGWDPFGREGQVGLMAFAEEGCYGPGSGPAGRVRWAKTLTRREIRRYTSMSYIDREGWLGLQPAEYSIQRRTVG